MDTVVLAYSGGLDTSVAIKWIKEKYNLDVIALTIDLGSERNLPEIKQRALNVGAIDAGCGVRLQLGTRGKPVGRFG